MEKKKTTERTRIEEIGGLPPRLTLSEEELRLIAGGRARMVDACTSVDDPRTNNVDYD